MQASPSRRQRSRRHDPRLAVGGRGAHALRRSLRTATGAGLEAALSPRLFEERVGDRAELTRPLQCAQSRARAHRVRRRFGWRLFRGRDRAAALRKDAVPAGGILLGVSPSIGRRLECDVARVKGRLVRRRGR